MSDEKQGQTLSEIATNPVSKSYKITTAKSACDSFKISINHLKYFLRSKGIKIKDASSVLDSYTISIITKQFSSPPKSNKSIEVKPRVLAICDVYNISTGTLFNFLENIGHNTEKLNVNSIISKALLSRIDEKFKKYKENKDKIRGHTEVKFLDTNSKSESKNKTQPFLYLSENMFKIIKQTITHEKLSSIKSFFSNNEAIRICSKMNCAFIRSLCKMIQKQPDNAELLYQIHFIANKAHDIYGGKILTFIYKLEQMDFSKNNPYYEVRTYTNVLPDFPILRLTVGDDTFKVFFFLKRGHNKSIKSDIRVFTKDNQEIGYVDKEGYIITRLESFNPHLTLFYTAMKDNSYSITAGVKAGSCEVCGRELTHPTSLKIGLGPECAKKVRVDDSIYVFK